MKAAELRMGNWVEKSLLDKSISIGYQIKAFDFKEWENAIYKPISLTEDWLKKFGFEKNDGKYGLNWFHGKYEDWTPVLRKDEFGFYWAIGDEVPAMVCIRLPYVHTLQNLYVALKEEELTIKK